MARLTTIDRGDPVALAPANAATTATMVQVAGAALFELSALFLTVIMLAASMAPGYDLTGGAISDLGTLRETAFVFNSALLTVGVLNILAGILLARAGASRWLLAVYVGAGVGAIGAGMVSLDRGDLHGLFALVAFVLFNVEAILSARLVRQPMSAISVLAGLVGLTFVGLMIVGDAGNPEVFGAIGHGGAERMIVYPVMLWLLGFGGALMASASVGTEKR